MNPVDIQHIIAISKQAAERILEIYRSSFAVSVKTDKSFLTEADLAAHTLITDALHKMYPAIPVISEESAEWTDYAVRKNWPYFFLVDPLDGTKEFINRNDEFTINIALIKNNQPILGVVHAPALNVIYHAEQGKGAYKIHDDQQIRLSPAKSQDPDTISVAVSRSHSCEKTTAFLSELGKQYKQVVTLSAGSALKFGLVAEGKADIYPRFTPTMEWDTAAGQVLISEIGKTMRQIESGEILRYNKAELKNLDFVVR